MGGIHVPARSAAADLAPGRGQRRGFTMVELMIVILIIGVVVAIVFPVLTGARNAARKAATTALMTDLANASTQFYTDHNRYPGYFSPMQMGHAENINRGFTAMENIILDLAGGIVQSGASPDIIDVGPRSGSNNTVKVDLTRIGAASEESKRYWQPDKKYYVAQEGDKQVGENAHKRLPDVVDAWGTPILAWVQDDPGLAANTHFALEKFDGGANADRARYYWASNAGFLKSKNLGRLSRNQPQNSTEAESGYSLLGERNNMREVEGTLAGFLGHPAYPDPNPANEAPFNDSTPKIGRAAIVFHSAGSDGYYLGSNDVGGKTSGPNRVLKYNPPAPAAVAGSPVPRQPDPLDGFDDLIVNAGSSN